MLSTRTAVNNSSIHYIITRTTCVNSVYSEELSSPIAAQCDAKSRLHLKQSGHLNVGQNENYPMERSMSVLLDVLLANDSDGGVPSVTLLNTLSCSCSLREVRIGRGLLLELFASLQYCGFLPDIAGPASPNHKPL